MVKAVQYHSFGDTEVLEMKEIPREVLEENQVRVKVSAVGLNPVDYKIYKGTKQLRMLSFVMKLRKPSLWFQSKESLFPRGVGRDFSGVITEVGAGVTNFSVGEEVFGTIISAPGLGTKKGSLATEITVPVSDIERKPATIDFHKAATMGVAALTVGGAFRRIDLKAEDVLVISGASGGIGSIAVQYAVALGATVIGIASEKNAEYLKSLGAIPVAYGEGVEQRIAQAVDAPITKFLDCFGGEYVKIAFGLGLKGNAIGTLVPSPPAIIKGAQFTGPRHSEYADFEKLASFVASGKVKLYIDQEYPFTIEAVREAYQSLESGHTRGKKVVVIDDAE